MHSSKTERQKITINIWTARCIPIILAGVVGYATYVLVVPLCAHYLLSEHHDVAAAAVILTIYFLLFLLMAASLLRLIYITMFNPPYLPLGPAALRDNNTYKSTEKEKSNSETDGIGGLEYASGVSDSRNRALGTKDDPDSPGLELFYTKNVFSCEGDGRPKWCSHCANWKPDRTHHCSDAGRCILKMDHFCPWVGGPVGETNFKFFIQYTGYTALYCLHLLVVMAVYVARQIQTEGETYNPQFTAILGIATFFFLFTAGMTGTSIDLAMKNLTQVERLGSKTRVHTLAILKPPESQLQDINPTLASQQGYREIVYPLALDELPTSIGNATIMYNPSHSPKHLPLQPGQTSTTQSHHRNSLNLSQIRLSERDSQASRRFAVLNMKQGDNPWDLGSRLLNWESVMGPKIIDWVLPIKRSPCCNHEMLESQFELGPAIDLLRSSVGFLRPEETRAYGGRKSERRPAEDLHRSSRHKRHQREKRSRDSNDIHGKNSLVPLEDLENQTPRHISA